MIEQEYWTKIYSALCTVIPAPVVDWIGVLIMVVVIMRSRLHFRKLRNETIP